MQNACVLNFDRNSQVNVNVIGAECQDLGWDYLAQDMIQWPLSWNQDLVYLPVPHKVFHD